MSNKLLVGFTGGVLGALALVLVMFVMQFADFGSPFFVEMYQSAFGPNPPADHIISAVLFLLNGGIWGLLFAAFVRYPTTFKGVAFGILPMLFTLVVLNPLVGEPIFNGFTVIGILMPVVFYMVIWGTFLGVYTAYNTKETAV